MADRDDNVYMAKLAEQAERYDDMVEAMKKIAYLDQDLSVEERNLLSVAYKNVIGSRRASWRIVNGLESKAENDEDRLKRTRDYRKIIEEELQEICGDILLVIEKHLIPAAMAAVDENKEAQNSAESAVFYQKMKGDYHRYLAEFSTGKERKDCAQNSLLAYKDASDLATKHLKSTNPIRLGLALNFSVFYYEILNTPDHACKLAKQAFDDAIAELDSLAEESYKDSTLIMQLLRDNLTLWTSDMAQESSQEQTGEEEKVQDIEAGDEEA